LTALLITRRYPPFAQSRRIGQNPLNDNQIQGRIELLQIGQGFSARDLAAADYTKAMPTISGNRAPELHLGNIAEGLSG
jgi:hypothetical protein